MGGAKSFPAACSTISSSIDHHHRHHHHLAIQNHHPSIIIIITIHHHSTSTIIHPFIICHSSLHPSNQQPSHPFIYQFSYHHPSIHPSTPLFSRLRGLTLHIAFTVFLLSWCPTLQLSVQRTDTADWRQTHFIQQPLTSDSADL